jgi:subtilisin family serine protease
VKLSIKTLLTISAMFSLVPAGPLPRSIGTFDLSFGPVTLPLKKTAGDCAGRRRLIALVNNSLSAKDLSAIDWRVVTRVGDVVTLEGCAVNAPLLHSIPGILFVKTPSPVTPLMDSVRLITRIDQVHGTRPGGIGRSLTGKGVLFGIIDTEFDTHHSAFLDSSGHTRFVGIWDQKDTTKKFPNRFGYGIIKTGASLDKDTVLGLGTSEFHGTFMASYAVGGDRKSAYYGAAPEAMIAGVRMGGSDANIIDGLKWLFSLADSLKRPCVVNMSLGIAQGPHDGSSLVDRVIDSLSLKPGHVVVGAVGNDGDKKSHVQLTMGRNEFKGAWVTGYASTDHRGRPATASVFDAWGPTGKTLTCSLFLLDTVNNTYRQSSGQITTLFNNHFVADTIVWIDSATSRRDTVFLQFETQRASALNARPGMLVYTTSTRPSLMLGFKMLVSGTGGTVHVWNGGKVAFASRQMETAGFSNGDTIMSVNELGGTALRNITVGAYVNRVPTRLQNGGLWGGANDPKDPHLLTHYSSRGPTLDGRIKPDITAPGSDVTGAMPRNMRAADAQIVFWPGWPDTTSKQGRYLVTGGTSVASPIVAGIVALMLQIDSTLTSEKARLILQQTAITDAATGPITMTTLNNLWGAGKVNALGAIQKMLGIVSGNSEHFTAAQTIPRMFFRHAGNRLFFERSNINVTSPLVIELFSVNGQLVRRETSARAVLSLANLPKGIYLARATSGGSLLCSAKLSVLF